MSEPAVTETQDAPGPRPMMHELAQDLGLTFAQLKELALGCGLRIGSGSRRVSIVEERRLRALAAERDAAGR